MSAYLNKQPSCCVDAEGRAVIEHRDAGHLHQHHLHNQQQQQPCSYNWQPQHQHQPQPPSTPLAHGYAPYPSSPCISTSTMPRQRAKLTASRSESSWRSPSRAASAGGNMMRSKGGSCDLWTSDCGCPQSWTEPYQVKRRGARR